MNIFKSLMLITSLFSVTTCQSTKKAEIFVVQQEKVTLSILLYNYLEAHNGEFPRSMHELLNSENLNLSSKEVSGLEKGWLYMVHPFNEVKNPDSDMVVLERNTSDGDVVRIKVRDIVGIGRPK